MQFRWLRCLLPGLIGCLALSFGVDAQNRYTPGAAALPPDPAEEDTAAAQSVSSWRDEDARVTYRMLNSVIARVPDSGLRYIHRRPFTQPWGRDLGNTGTPVLTLLFTPEFRVGPTFGYHVFDAYRMLADSLRYYHTNRPFSVFGYRLGSKSEQAAEILHTQNVTPLFNFAVAYRKTTSPGFYKLQRTVQDAGSVSMSYSGPGQHYIVQGGIAYNKMQQEENGGIPLVDSFLDNSRYTDRGTIPVAFQNDEFSNRKSSVTNKLRDFTLLLQHSYTLGTSDTTYNVDSTQITSRLNPRYRLTHQLRIGSDKHDYKDVRPDSVRYNDYFQKGIAKTDSVFSEQTWAYVDNRLLAEGLLGPKGRQARLQAGFGVRADRFGTNTGLAKSRLSILSNYVTGNIRKEATRPKQWSYQVAAIGYLTGDAAGNFAVNGQIAKSMSDNLGTISIGGGQRAGNAPYNFTTYQNAFDTLGRTYARELISTIEASIANGQIAEGGIRNYLVTNYIYLNTDQTFAQQAKAFSVLQLWVKKSFHLGKFVFDNELTYQQKASGAPINVPALMGRNQLSYERYLFARSLRITTGIDLRWHTGYKAAGYSPYFNRFYFRDDYQVSNVPELSVFFSFRVKKFRAYISGDQVQQAFARNNINFPGYVAQNLMLRFGFQWTMVN